MSKIDEFNAIALAQFHDMHVSIDGSGPVWLSDFICRHGFGTASVIGIVQDLHSYRRARCRGFNIESLGGTKQ